jgi:hypothetical protein
MRLVVRFFVVGLALVLLGQALVSPAAAQVPLHPAANEEALLGGPGDKLLTKENSKFGDLRHGKERVTGPGSRENMEILKKAARWYAYRLTNPIYLEKEKNPEGFTMNDLVNQAYDKLLLVPEIRSKRPLKDEQKEYLKHFSTEMIACLRDVLSKNAKPIVRINATRILSGIAEAGQEDAAESLCQLIQNPRESDAVKLYAFEGLKELFDQGSPDRSIITKADREAECIKAINQFIQRPNPLPAKVEADEIAALQFVRREAIRALGVTRYPIVPKVAGPEGLTALTLYRVLQGKIDPPSSLTERAEAAIGLCQLRLSLNKDYHADVAVHEAGRFLVDFITEYNNQRLTKVSTLPWRWYTARLWIALEQLDFQARNTGPKDVSAYVTRIVGAAQKELRPLEVDKDGTPPDLDAFLTANPPANKEILKGVGEATLKTATPPKK